MKMDTDSLNQSLARAKIAKPTINVSNPIGNAIVLWTEATTGVETEDREERMRIKRVIVRSFLDFVGKHPGEVEAMDVLAWRKSLEAEKSENTVYTYLSRVSSFYEWLRRHPEVKDLIRSNPVSVGRPKAPRPYQTDKTKAWTDEEMNAILDRIAAEAEAGSVHALRDYAVTLFYLFSGLRRNELFRLRGNDLKLSEEGVAVSRDIAPISYGFRESTAPQPKLLSREGNSETPQSVVSDPLIPNP
jgi:integrase